MEITIYHKGKSEEIDLSDLATMLMPYIKRELDRLQEAERSDKYNDEAGWDNQHLAENVLRSWKDFSSPN
jgi:hypothetical protein